MVRRKRFFAEHGAGGCIQNHNHPFGVAGHNSNADAFQNCS
jgi:hypothetical protein